MSTCPSAADSTVPAVPGVSQAAIDELNRVVFRFRGQLHRLSQSAGVQANPMELKCLFHIRHHPGCTASDVVRHSGRDKGQVARLLQQLETQGWIAREPDSVDRRVQRLRVTAQGEQVHAQLHRVRDAQAGAMLARLTEPEQALLVELLRKLNHEPRLPPGGQTPDESVP